MVSKFNKERPIPLTLECRNLRKDVNGCRGRLGSGRRKSKRSSRSKYRAGVECNGMCCKCAYIDDGCSLVFLTKKGRISYLKQCYQRCMKGFPHLFNKGKSEV